MQLKPKTAISLFTLSSVTLPHTSSILNGQISSSSSNKLMAASRLRDGSVEKKETKKEGEEETGHILQLTLKPTS